MQHFAQLRVSVTFTLQLHFWTFQLFEHHSQSSSCKFKILAVWPSTAEGFSLHFQKLPKLYTVYSHDLRMQCSCGEKQM